MEEIWKDIEGYEGLYQVSNLGNVKSLAKGTQLKPFVVNTNYHMVDLYKGNVRRKFYVHRLVASAFLGENNDKPFVNHKNFNRKDNRLENLEWCTPTENVQHGYDMGKTPRGSVRKSTKLTEDEVFQIKKRLANKEKQVNIAKDFNISFVTVSDIKRNIYWKQITI